MGLFRKTAKADLVVYNCTIYSSVGEKPFFGAVACRDGKITAIGDMDSLAPLMDSETRSVDLSGRYVIPGLIKLSDSPVMKSFCGRYMDLTHCEGMESLSDVLTFWNASHPDDEIVFGYGYDESIFEGRSDENDDEEYSRQKTAETIAVLDRIFPDRPAVLLCGSTVSCIMNTAASNIVNEAAEEEMVQYITAPYILNLLIPFDFEPIYEEACLRIQEDLSAGFTSVINLGSPDYFEALYQDALISLYNDDSLDQRFFGSYMMNRPLLPKGLVRKLMERKTICNEIDGMIGAEMLNIRLDNSSAPISFSMHALEQILTEAADKGFKIYISAAGSGDVELALNGLEHIRSKGFKNPFTIESIHDPAMFSEQFIYSQTCIYIDPAVLRGECTTEEYLSALTLTASEAAGLDNCAGSIEKGKYADMLVYSTDPMDMSPGQLMESGPDMVIINGKIVSSSMMEVVK